MGAIQFKKAVKYEAKGRVALIGPAGSGKSFTGLTMARELAGADGKIAAVDTEHGSLSKYADLFDFDVFEMDSFSPNNFMEALKAAENNGYAVFFCDSLSHFWMGKDGALEFVDTATKRSQSRDGMAGWKDFSPIERRMVDAMIASPCHVITTMRTKTEYQEQEYTNSRGEKKKQRVKVGLAPVQRQGLEYEFDLIGYMDENNALLIDKTRCPDYTGKVISAPKAADFAAFGKWLIGAHRDPTEPPAPPAAAPKPGPVPVSSDPAIPTVAAFHSADKFGRLRMFGDVKKALGEKPYYKILGNHGVEHANEFTKLATAEAALAEMLAEYADQTRSRAI